jgi:asparagine synthase (glutamine-hydrolysing)
VERYWRFHPKSRIRYKTDAEYEEHFRRVFRQSVQRRLRSDSPILAELSGGLDSSSIVCMADDIVAKESAETPGLDTLSYYDNTEPSGDDWIYFQKVEAKRGRVGIHIDGSNIVSSPASLRCSDPLPGAFGFRQKLGVQRADVVRGGGYRAVLSGIGGDEFMGGIPDPRAHLADLIVQLKFVSLARQLMAWSLVKRRPWIQLLWQSAMILLPDFLGQYLAKPTKVQPWVEKDFAKRTRLANRLLGPNEAFGLWLPTRRSYVGGVVLMANKLAKFTPSVSALEEARYPYLDQDLIEFILAIPASQMLRPGERRSLMRRSLAGIVPEEILARKTKQFAARTPIVVLEQNSDQMQTLFDSPLTSRLGYVNQSRFMEGLRAARNGKDVPIVHLMGTIALEVWMRDFASQRLIVPATTPRPNVTAVSQEATA